MASIGKKSGGGIPTWIWIAGIAVAVGYYLLRQIKGIAVGGATGSVWGGSLNGIELRVQLSGLNERDLSIPVEGFLGYLHYIDPDANNGAGEDINLGLVQQIAPVTLAPHSPWTIEFRCVVPLLSAGQLGYKIYKILADPLQKVDWTRFRVVGTLRAGGFNVPVDQQLMP